MEQSPNYPDENEDQPRLPGEAGYEAAADPLAQTIGFEFGFLDKLPPEGGSWSEWVISRGIEEALREERPIDDRTARYIAVWLSERATPGLRTFALTGAIDEPRIQEELVFCFFYQTEQVQSWVNRLGDYCLRREDRGPVEEWREAIERQDWSEVQRVRRERVLAQLDHLFDGQAEDELAGVEELGWFGLVRHDGHSGGWILGRRESGMRDVWETDSDAELLEHWKGVVDEYMRLYRLTRPQVARANGQLSGEQQTEDGSGEADPSEV